MRCARTDNATPHGARVGQIVDRHTRPAMGFKSQLILTYLPIYNKTSIKIDTIVLSVNLQEIGQLIQRTRKARGLTQAALAAQAHVSRYTLLRLEKGAASDIQFKTLAAILLVLRLQITVTELPVSGVRILGES